ncbi:MAG: membrane dipeptidase [Spirochaetia bacterium]|nr:membrane dipeptidase [Spirochaetia bacterium]
MDNEVKTRAEKSGYPTHMLFDAHQELLDEYLYTFILHEPEVLQNRRSVFTDTYLPVLKAQGVKFVSAAIGGDHTSQVIYSTSENRFWDAHKKLDALLTEEENGCQAFRICRNNEDIDTVLASNQIGLFIGISGGRPLEGKKNLNLLSSLRSLYRGGLRRIQLTGNGRNRLADGVGQSRTGGKLTRFGRQVVREAERLHIVIDTAQLSDSGFYDLAEYTSNPLIDSHTCAAAVSPHPRNISDDRIRILAQKGGVIGISFMAALAAVEKEHPGPEDLLRHIDHIVELAGIDHVALGPDYSAYAAPVCRDRVRGYGNLGPHVCDFDRLTPLQNEKYPGRIEGIDYGIRKSDYVSGPETHEKFSLMQEILSDHGYSQEEAGKILGRNMLRIYRTILT